MPLEPPLVRAPDFHQGPWLQSLSPITIEGLRGQVGLIHFWDFTCINCVRTLPYLRAWIDRYADAGFLPIGIHTPEFPFAGDARLVAKASGRLGIRWPVLLDNDQHMWTSYANRYWPTMYLIDARGYIRYRREGEGGYEETENALRELLEAASPGVFLPPVVGLLREEDAAGAVCAPVSPELEVDSLAGGRPDLQTYSLPLSRPEGQFYAEGTWVLEEEALTLAEAGGSIVVPFRAADVYAVLSSGPTADSLPADPVLTSIELDGRPLASSHYGADIFLDRGHSCIRVEAPRLYHLVSGLPPSAHELRLRADTPGWTLYSFSFGTCLVTPSTLTAAPEEARSC
ncbi:MAG TPA: redoxin domain-containing protein [Anaerolineales bacterium]|nr:redoxin domain-containing protein [Anaerolineales bacterium]